MERSETAATPAPAGPLQKVTHRPDAKPNRAHTWAPPRIRASPERRGVAQALPELLLATTTDRRRSTGAAPHPPFPTSALGSCADA